MVISFSSEKARNYLLAKGFVYSFRTKRRTMLGKDWMNEKRGEKKISDVYIVEVGLYPMYDLGPWAKESGFKNLKNWIAEVVVLNWRPGGTTITSDTRGWLYYVTLRGLVKDAGKGAPIEPDDNVRTTHYYGGYEENEAGEEVWTETIDEVNTWFCEYAEFGEDGKCHGCDGGKGGRADCEPLNPLSFSKPEDHPGQERLF